MKDIFKTIKSQSTEVLFKDRGSKFFGYAFPISHEDELSHHLDILRKKHPKAGHHCYAYRIGVEGEKYRANDDGEPSNSAGAPILGQLQSFDLTNTLVVVTRIFGGTKLGVSGLIHAYKETAKLAIETTTMIKKTIDGSFKIEFGYPMMSKVMRIIDEEKLKIISQEMQMSCKMELGIRKSELDRIIATFEKLHPLEVIEDT